MNKAVEIFTQVPKTCNCAQAVAAGCGHEELLAEMALCGGGKAPEGRCGALHAALCLIPESRHAEAIRAFKEAAGSQYCRTIRPLGVFPCAKCVEVAADLVEKLKN